MSHTVFGFVCAPYAIFNDVGRNQTNIVVQPTLVVGPTSETDPTKAELDLRVTVTVNEDKSLSNLAHLGLGFVVGVGFTL